ncbi:hypothetical protein M2138_001891 [Dysgonomonadaceae bacterium PH5-43]|nr:hypothetical protein [Dysgonomonadaceae bacterium PH5-43]
MKKQKNILLIVSFIGIAVITFLSYKLTQSDCMRNIFSYNVKKNISEAFYDKKELTINSEELDTFWKEGYETMILISSNTSEEGILGIDSIFSFDKEKYNSMNTFLLINDAFDDIAISPKYQIPCLVIKGNPFDIILNNTSEPVICSVRKSENKYFFSFLKRI